MVNFEIPVIAIDYETPHNTRGEGVKDKKLTGDYLLDVYIIIVSTENKPLSTTTKIPISITWVCVNT